MSYPCPLCEINIEWEDLHDSWMSGIAPSDDDEVYVECPECHEDFVCIASVKIEFHTFRKKGDSRP